MKRHGYLFAALLLLIGSSCHQPGSPLNDKVAPIVLGDSSTIVTEKDSAYLTDDVEDMNPQSPVAAAISDGTPKQTSSSDSSVNNPPATSPDNAQSTASPNSVAGFQINFGQGVTATFSDLETKSFTKQDPANSRGVSYKITSGDLSKSQLVISGLKNIKVRQRYQTELKLVFHREQLQLNSLGTFLSGWQNLNAKNNTSFPITGISQPEYSNITNARLQDAVIKATRSRRGRPSPTANTWLQRIRGTKSANDAPCQIILNNVQWQIIGTDNSGKPFVKNIRMDL